MRYAFIIIKYSWINSIKTQCSIDLDQALCVPHLFIHSFIHSAGPISALVVLDVIDTPIDIYDIHWMNNILQWLTVDITVHQALTVLSNPAWTSSITSDSIPTNQCSITHKTECSSHQIASITWKSDIE